MYISMPYSAFGCSFSSIGQAYAIYQLASKNFFNSIPIVNSVTYTLNGSTYTTTIEFKSCPNLGLRFSGLGSGDASVTMAIIHLPTNTSIYSYGASYCGYNNSSHYFVCAWDSTTFYYIPNVSTNTVPAKIIFDYRVSGKDTLTSCHDLEFILY